MNKKILIVGGGFGQMPAIIKAKELGLKVIVVDQNPLAIGMKYADHAYPIDVIDKKEILSIAKKHGIHGAMTMQSDLPVPTIGFLNDELHLKGVSFDVANYCSNKIETRNRLQVKGCSQPDFKIVRSIADAEKASKLLGFPCVIKAPDSSGSRGVIKVNSIEEVSAAFTEALSFSRGEEILVEEFIEGLEFGAQTFSVEGHCELVLLHNDTMSNPPYMIPIGHSFPFEQISEDKCINAIEDIKKAVESLGINDGPANVDLILDKKNNKVKVIEVGARIGATCLPELVKYHTGIDWVEATIKSALGEKVNLAIQKEEPVAAIIIESPNDGLYQGYEIKKSNIEDLLEFEITAKVDEPINKLRKGTDRIGKIIAYGKNLEEAEKKVLEFRESILIKVK